MCNSLRLPADGKVPESNFDLLNGPRRQDSVTAGAWRTPHPAAILMADGLI
jgi:hypothetical protein